jgi:hypothetical protein
MKFLRVPLLFLVFCFFLSGAERDALLIDANIQARHVPYGMVLNPILTKDGSAIADYTRCGDSALWTGHYLAAEAFRYKVTGAADALTNLQAALNGLTLLVNITGNDVLARCALPADSPYASSISSQESNNGIFHATVNGKPWIWVGNTSRDQYCGVFFGLGAAYDLVTDAGLRASMASLATRMINNLSSNLWTVTMPNLSVSTTFLIRPDQQLTLLQVGQHLNPQAFASDYSRQAGLLAGSSGVPLAAEAADNQSSYFKFNLDFINLYNLIRLQGPSAALTYYESGFTVIRAATIAHHNAHFNMIDRALHGPHIGRDTDTRAALDEWLTRPRTDVFVDWRGKIPSCGNANEACNPLPVAERPPSDFLWQLDPYQLSGGGSGVVETAGIDYILPYWMARYYGVITLPETNELERRKIR